MKILIEDAPQDCYILIQMGKKSIEVLNGKFSTQVDLAKLEKVPDVVEHSPKDAIGFEIPESPETEDNDE